MNALIAKYPHVILFDGVCNLCSGSVQFIIKRDPNERYKFASLQSELGARVLAHLGLSSSELHSIILVEGNRHLQRSDAALEIARNLSGGWPLLYVFKIIPRFLRDPVYNWISRNRYAWFGKKDACWLPTPDLKSRFLDG